MRATLLGLVLLTTGCMHGISFVDSGIPYARHPNVSPSQERLHRPGDPMPRFVEIGYLHDGCSRVSHDRHGTHSFVRLAATCVWVEPP